MKSTKSNLTSAFLSYRRARLMACAVLSVSTLRMMQSQDDKDANRRIAQLVKERSSAMDDSTDSADLYTISCAPVEMGKTSFGSVLLTPAERVMVKTARPSARSVVEYQPVVVVDEPLPPDFVPPFVHDFVPAYTQEEQALAITTADFELDVEALPLLLTA